MPTAQDYLELESSAWNELNPGRCPCRGTGWMNSDFDTYHKCHIHGTSQTPHPEDEESTFDMAAHVLAQYRYAYHSFRRDCVALGFLGTGKDFIAECERHMVETNVLTRRPCDWVNAAEDIAGDFNHVAEASEAMRRGFSCSLEMRWADEAQCERAERERGYYDINGY